MKRNGCLCLSISCFSLAQLFWRAFACWRAFAFSSLSLAFLRVMERALEASSDEEERACW
ncbi:hypothetical protein NC653_015576 [Populus alba x Populus x berolinensis]|uniref:Uncharacterized protein n=1 Tax=Populus alba x Populus x berolinensis TaxID=444605 RepID=A0AAD6QKV7_9ROSI|nr:hypothetical protein NC653_015576 [Populus alba x Populus x berolinensis]